MAQPRRKEKAGGAVTTPKITKVTVSGADVQIDFRAGLRDAPSAFTVVAAAQVEGPFVAVNAPIIQLGPDAFRATAAVSGGQSFYRVMR